MAQLLYQTAFIGDLLLSIPLILELRRRKPGIPIHLVCRKGLGSFFEKLKLVEQSFEVEKGQGGRPYRALLALLKDQNYDYIWCPHESVRSALLVRRIKAQHRVGYSHWWNGWIFDQRVKRPMHRPESLRQMSLLARVDPQISTLLEGLGEFDNPSQLHLWSSEEVRPIPEWASMNLLRPGILSTNAHAELKNLALEQISQLQLQGKRYAVIAPGSVWPTKRWSVEGYVEVAKQLVNRGFGVLLIGAKGELEVCDEIYREVPGVKNWAGRTDLWGSFALLSGAEFFVGNDSGATHLASCAGIPVVAQFGPTTLSFGYRPWNDHCRIVQHDIFCRPCGKHGSSRCPLGTHECMKRIQPREVLEAIDSLKASSLR